MRHIIQLAPEEGDCKMKTVSVRIGAEQAKKLHEVADQMSGCSLNGLVQRAVDLYLEVEAPVYLAAFKEARAKLGRKP